MMIIGRIEEKENDSMFEELLQYWKGLAKKSFLGILERTTAFFLDL